MDIYPPNPDLKPYTYRIDCLSNGMWYWGVRKPHRWPDGYMGTPCARIPGTDKVKMLEDIKKYGKENFKKTVLEFFDRVEEARDAEYDLITPDLNDPMCYNGANGRTFASGEKHPRWGRTFQHTEESRQKMSASQKGRIVSNETRRRMSKAQTGRIVSNEARRKLSEAITGKNHYMYGKKHSEKTRRRMSEAQTGRTFSKESRQKMSASAKKRALSKDHRRKLSEISGSKIPISCIYCRKTTSVPNHVRWHGERCSLAPPKTQ